jgi:hypothetical protein
LDYTEYSKCLIESIYPHVHAYIHDRFPLEQMQLMIQRGRMDKLHTEYESLVCQMILRCMPRTDGMKESFFMSSVLRECAPGRLTNERFIYLTRQWIELRESC